MFRFLKNFQNLGSTILFIFLECICLFLIIRFNQGQNAIFLHSSNEIVSDFVQRKSRIKQSLDLKSQNDDLLGQNAKLIEEIVNLNRWIDKDSIEEKTQFEVMSANIVNNNIHTVNNYITLDKGANDGIKKGMGVMADKGLVGVVNQTSAKYATAISMLNVNLRIAASIEGKDYFGYITWTGTDFFLFDLVGIPKHAEIEIGDKVVTSGHSSIFPKGLNIGEVEEYTIDGGGAFYKVSVRVDQDLSKTALVYIVLNHDFEEIQSLESENED